jgi:hypothetical protein
MTAKKPRLLSPWGWYLVLMAGCCVVAAWLGWSMGG